MRDRYTTGSQWVRLTQHEREILTLYSRGVRGQRLAEEKQITYNTVRTHYQRICQKLDQPDMLSAAIRLAERGGEQ